MNRTLVKETTNEVGKEVKLLGWVDTIRDHGRITFIDLRDRSGIVQCVGQDLPKLTPESVVEVVGKVAKRPEKLVNTKLETGTVEIQISILNVISESKELPLPIDNDGYDIDEVVRLKYRYLDLRRQRMNRNIKVRSLVAKFMRNFLLDRDFVEIETPILTKTTPEGARDFLVPSRLQPGNFYALPQSPQQYKQLLMVAGFERYFQIARCFRDEDPRKDRAYGEFTQLDIEMSFVTQEDILRIAEELFTKLIKEVFPDKKISQSPWPRLSHKDAMEKYGTDKPDLRKDKNDPNELAFAWTIDFPLFTEQSEEDFFHGSGSAKFAPSHHMFTAPHPDDVKLLDTDPTKVRGLQHDMVLNGFEVGGGSIRIHQPAIQEKVFDLIGFSDKQKAQFEHMLTAFTYGVPPHGGIAPGLDRFLFAVLGEPSIREVMAFPATASGQTAVLDAPSPATEEQLRELKLEVKKNTNGQYFTVYKEIIEVLDEKDIKYKKYTHKPVFTSVEAAKVRKTKLHQGAKALVLKAGGEFLLYVLPADVEVDLDKLKNTLKVKDLGLASKDEVFTKTGLEIGSVPPFGSLIHLETVVDSRIKDNKDIAFNAGSHERSIMMSLKDYIKVENPQIVDIK